MLTVPDNGTPSSSEGVKLQLGPGDLETLLKLQEAGLLDLEGLDEIQAHDPKHVDWTYEAFHKHMIAKQGLAQQTAEYRVRYVRFLETHDEMPVDLRPPSEESYLEHIYHRRGNGAPGSTLNHYRKAMKSLLKFLEIPTWESLDTQFPQPRATWTLPPDELVPRFWMDTDAYGLDDAYERDLLAHVYHFGFHTGVRPPSEIVALDVSDVDFDDQRVTITEKKKGNKRRDLQPVEAFVITGKDTPSLKNYLDHHRPRVDDGQSDAFFLDKHGKRPNPIVLRQTLSRVGKRIWPKFKPYTMRRWFATQMLIASDFNIYVVAERLGDSVRAVENHYLDKAKALSHIGEEYQLPRFQPE